MRVLVFFLQIGLVIFSGVARGSVTMPGDVSYEQIRHGQTLYIFDPEARNFVDQAIAYVESLKKAYGRSFTWELDEEMDLALLSGRQQIANGYATTYPNVKTVWYPGGGAALESMASSSWLLALSTHETAHLYQLNAKLGLNEYLSRVVGNSLLLSTLVPIVIHPNLLTPTFLLEGNAVLNESRVNLGGRLHSGEVRALVLAQILAGSIDPNRLINDGFEFPFGEESYAQGGYFQAHLAAKYGVEKTNSFFLAQGAHYINPLILNQTFREHFGASYAQEIREYVRGLEALAVKQRASHGRRLIQAHFASPLNADDRRIFFLTSNGAEPPRLHEFDKRDGRFTSRRIDLLFGKPFFLDGQPVTAATHQNDLRHVTYGLYGEGARSIAGFDGQIVNDLRAGKSAALAAKGAWLEPRVLIDGENFDVAHSQPILDAQGLAYYFRQNGGERILYRGREPLFKYEGFYGKVLEVTADGKINFIANTDFGASLFSWRDGEVTRELESDRVIDARMISPGRFLVVEIDAGGHAVEVVNATPRAALPALYSYGFPSTNLRPDLAPNGQELEGATRAYGPWREMRYSSLNLAMGYSRRTRLREVAQAIFTDPLEFQRISLSSDTSELAGNSFRGEYVLTKYLADYYARYTYHESDWDRATLSDLREYNQGVRVGALVPLWRWRRWDAALDFSLNYLKDDFERSPAQVPVNQDRELYGSFADFGLSYSLNPALGFRPWREFTVHARHQFASRAGSLTKEESTGQVATSYTHGFTGGYFVVGDAQVAWAEGHHIPANLDRTPLIDDIRVPRLTGAGPAIDARNAASLGVEISRAFTVASYSARLPIGVSRAAPLANALAVFLDDDPSDRYFNSFAEWGLGAEFELLLAHKVPVRLRWQRAFNTVYDRENETKMSLGYTAMF